MTGLEGLRVLVVEDEATVAMLIEDMLEDFGCTVVASVASLSAARAATVRADIDFAMLDINLAGEFVFPVAEILRARGVPFLFSTGYGTIGLPAEFSSCQVVAKPFSQPELQAKIILTLDRWRCLTST